jgi:PAS domain S-box-containing protein
MEDKRYKILLIEDDELDQMAFKQLVERENLPYVCKMVGSVSQAQSILSSERFDVVISDYLLGNGTGFDIMDSVKNTPFILVTGTGDEEIAVKAWKAGAYDYLIKDLERNYLKMVPITVENAIRHKKTKEKLQLLSRAIMSTTDSVYIADMENKIIFVNRAFCKTYGYREEEIIGKNSNILCKENPPAATPDSHHRAFGEQRVESYHARKDGGEFPVSISVSFIKDENEIEIAHVIVARDISERIFVEDKVRTINLKLKRENRLMS